jgi:cytochrome c biogenesis protein CcmG, thiol:disulfide interchange protein DsbE
VSTHRHRALCFGLSMLAPLLLVGGSVVASPQVGQPAPALIVRQLDGHVLDLSALRGKVVVLNFWASWCPPCRAEMPMLEAFYRKHRSEGVLVVGLSADDPHERQAASRAMQGLTYPAAMLVDAKPNGFGAPQALPVTYVIGPEGVIRARLASFKKSLTEQDLTAVVMPLLPRDAGATPRQE